MLEIGAIYDGKITGLTGFGAFVSLPDGKSGMVHISEVSNTFVKDIKDVLKEGQEVKVKVVGISPEGKISLSIKKAQEPSEEEKNSRKNDRPKGDRPKSDRPRNANVWQGQPKQNKGAMTFEEMMAQFKQVSDEKMTDLKRNSDAKHSGGYSRRGKNN
ncbi:MAG: S1 RNA-binding domain-containing protein [Clostridia bacterium]|jgi:S1 RNA binding domain protein|nr:S1 RNA-binding domain-containing protein [Clostridia bacterium]MBQ1996151.1 S1 RNA-binding domain-containing protein [Clostridia bacterium]MBQ5904684.1 S1 RNA-binding domain-containing protein [Clostridia bacterium]